MSETNLSQHTLQCLADCIERAGVAQAAATIYAQYLAATVDEQHVAQDSLRDHAVEEALRIYRELRREDFRR